jgi:ribose transport system ATP-binding protein
LFRPAGKPQHKCRNAGQEVCRLSGGNQQKVAIGRVLFQEAEILLLDEPTRGIDVGTKAEIYRLMDQLAQQGKAILFVSSYLPELLGICDRIAVMNRGRLVALRDIADWTEESILSEAVA